jgi:hypothetical protein
MKNPNKLHLLLYLLFSASTFTASAQVNIENNTISNAGEYYSGSWGSLQVTIAGEPVIETIGGGNTFFTQGFEQPQLKGVGIISLPTNAPTINLYPNPTSGEVNIAFNLPNAASVAAGKTVIIKCGNGTPNGGSAITVVPSGTDQINRGANGSPSANSWVISNNRAANGAVSLFSDGSGRWYTFSNE